MKRLATYLLFSVCCFGLAQENIQERKISKVDSLRMVVRQAAQDTEAVNNRFRMIREFIKASQFDSSKKYAQEALELSTRIGFVKGQAGAYNNLGVTNHYLGNYPEALSFYEKALRIRETLGDKKGLIGSYSNMGKIYTNQGNYPKALERFLKALAIAEKEKGVQSTQAALLNDIGTIYLDTPPKALEYYKRSLKMYEAIGEKQGIANESNNVGTMYMEMKDKAKALEYFDRALKLKQELGDKKGIANTLDNLGVIYLREGKYEQALACHQQSLKLNIEMGEKYSVSSPLNSLATVYMHMGKYPLAVEHGLKSLAIAKEVGAYDHIKDAEKNLYQAYEKMGNTTEAYKHYKGFITARDTLYNEDNTRQTVKAEMNFEFEKQQAVEKAEQEKKDALHREELARKEMVKNFFIVGFLVLLAFSFLIYRNFRQKKKANVQLAMQKKEIELQKALVEEKNVEVTDSIKYAQRIQNALLTSERYVKKHLDDFFILSRARDIVSGDFYWFLKKDDRLYVATADCTGHGVPGAFMSMLGINFLNEIIIERHIHDPGKVLDALRKEIINALNPEGTTELTKDGMDIVLCCYDLANMNLSYSAANNSFYLVRDNKIYEQKFDKMPVGVYDETQNGFTTHTLTLQKGDLIYTFTDGYADQFGGLKGKKFKYKQFEKILVSNSHLAMHEQKNILIKSHDDWKGNLEQVDDVLIIGMRV